MEKAQILSTLKEKLGQTSLSERTLTEYVNNVLPAEGVEPDEAYFTSHVGILKALGGQYNHDIAEYQRQNPYRQQQQHQDPPVENPEIAALKQQMQQMQDQLKQERSGNAIAAVRAALSGKGDELKVRNKAIWEDAVKSLSIKEGDTVDSILATAKSSYEAMQKRYLGDGAQPYGSGKSDPSTDAEAQKKLREAYRQKLIEDGKIPSGE